MIKKINKNKLEDKQGCNLVLLPELHKEVSWMPMAFLFTPEHYGDPFRLIKVFQKMIGTFNAIKLNNRCPACSEVQLSSDSHFTINVLVRKRRIIHGNE